MMSRISVMLLTIAVLFFGACAHEKAVRHEARLMAPAPFTDSAAARAATAPVEEMRAEQPYSEVAAWVAGNEELDEDAAEDLKDILDALADDPGSAGLRLDLGEALLKYEAFALAIAPLKDAFFLRPGNFRAAALLADAYVKAQRRREALALARRLVGDNPHSYERWLFRAEVARRAGLDEEAMQSARRTLLIRPEVAEAKAVLGFIYADKGRKAIARKLLDEVADADGVQGFAVKHRLGKMALEEEKYDEALAYFRAALEEHPDYAPARNDLGLTYTKLGRWEEARSQFESAVEADPELAEAQLNLANLYIDEELDGDAKRALRQAARVGTDPAAFFLAAGRLYSLKVSTATGREAAMTYFEKAKPLVAEETRAQIERAMEKFASLPPAATPVDEPVQAADVPEPVSAEKAPPAKQAPAAPPPSTEQETGEPPTGNDEPGPSRKTSPNAGGAIESFRPSVK